MATSPQLCHWDRVKYWEIIADNLKKRGWSLGYVSAVNFEERTIWIADAHRDDGRRFVVRADELLTAFIELESAIRVAVNSRKATAINCLTTDRRAFAGFLLLCHTRLHPPEHNTW
jgi:uncharacterized DUF497 family protein